MKSAITRLFFLLLLAMAGTVNAQQWEVLHTGVTEDLYNICCIDDNVIFVCGKNGVILKSIDGGESWEEKYRKTGCQMTELCFADLDNGYAVCDSIIDSFSHQWLLVKTCDGGETWNEVGTPVFSWIERYVALDNDYIRTELFMNDTDNLLVAVSFDGIYHSNDGGLTMIREDNDFSINETRGMFFEDNVGYLLWNYEEGDFIFPERNAGIAKTEDTGETWTLIENVSNISTGMLYGRFFDKNHIRLYGDFTISEFDAASILETFDGFETFEMSGYGYWYIQFAEEYIRVKFTKNGWGMAMLWEEDMPGVGRSVSYTEDDGLTWTSYLGLPFYRLYDIDGVDTTFFISCENGRVLKNRQLAFMDTMEDALLTATVYPNPADDEIAVCGENINTVELYSVLGTCLVKKQEIDLDKTIFDIHALDPGIYYLKIIEDKGKFIVKKIIKK